VTKGGKFGVYVANGEVNVLLGRGDCIENMIQELAYDLLAIRRKVMVEKGITPNNTGDNESASKKPS